MFSRRWSESSTAAHWSHPIVASAPLYLDFRFAAQPKIDLYYALVGFIRCQGDSKQIFVGFGVSTSVAAKGQSCGCLILSFNQ